MTGLSIEIERPAEEVCTRKAHQPPHWRATHMAVSTTRLTRRLQGSAAVPASVRGVTGAGLLAFTPDEPT
jgi:hypothetical protein